MEQNEDPNSRQRTFSRLFELYYNSNISNLSNTLKRCIPDIDYHFQNRFIKKNDKIWVEANLLKILPRASEKLQKILISKNCTSRNTIQEFHAKFQNLTPEIKNQIITTNKQKNSEHRQSLKQKQNILAKPSRNESFSLQTLDSEPSCAQNKVPRKLLSSKRAFRVRQFKNNLDEIINNTRYIEKLQRVKLQSTFTQFFFKQQPTPQYESIKTLEIDRRCINKLKAMTNIRCSFNTSYKFFKSNQNTVTQHQTHKSGNFLGLQTPKQKEYKPKSKCNYRNQRISVNF